MNWQEDDEYDGRGNDPGPWRPRRTKPRLFEEETWWAEKREKRSGKRAHRQKTMKDDLWPDQHHHGRTA